MGEIGVPELLIMLAIAIVLFGPARIGGVGKSLGEALRSIRHAVRGQGRRTPAVEQPEAAQPYPPDDQALLREAPNARE
jgi:sec-independent protein translocase protein TatA